MKTFIQAAVLGISLFNMTGSAMAHGADPKYGGVSAAASEFHFELVNSNGTAVSRTGFLHRLVAAD